MANENEFEVWLGRGAPDGKSARLTNKIVRSANLAGGLRRVGGRSARRFTGTRIGRGSGICAVVTSGGSRGRYSRRVVVKASFVRLGAKGLPRASAHLRYLQRDGTTREGGRGSPYSEREDSADGKAFVERGSGDRHQFRFIVAAEDGSQYIDLKPLVRRLMQQVETDLKTRLDWIAVDHFNTGHPHSHILVRGKDDKGENLVIARDYISRGIRDRAVELVNLDRGPRSELEIQRSRLREIQQERFTSIDRQILSSIDEHGLVEPHHRNQTERDLRLARLRQLQQMGLATEEKGGRWRLDQDLETTLRRMGMRGDIIKTMNRELALVDERRLPQDQNIYESGADNAPLIGRLVAQGLSDEHADRRYIILDGCDGLTHYVDIGQVEIDAGKGAILSINPRIANVRDVDRTIAGVAAASDGIYSVDLHLRHHRAATQQFAEAHVRRLEALRRTKTGIEREPDGSWKIPGDYLDLVQTHERSIAKRLPVTISVLSDRPLDVMVAHNGATWLDRELRNPEVEKLGGGFGADLSKAIRARLQWLKEQGLIEPDGYRFKPGAIEELERRDLRRTAAMLAQKTGKTFVEPKPGERIEGICRGSIVVGDRQFTLIEKSREFSLVPWRPVLEPQIGREISGIVRERGISWSFGRERQGPSIGM